MTQTLANAVVAFALTTAAGLAAAQDFSGTLGSPGFSGSYISAFTVHDDGTGPSLYATGSCSISGVGAEGSLIGRWDGAAWQPVGGGLQNNYSNALTSFQGDLIAAGYFDTAGSVAGTAKLARWDGAAWNSMDAQSESFLNSMWDLEVYDDGITGEQLYIAGNYVNLNGMVGLDHIAKWDGANYSTVGGTIGGAVPLIVLDLTQADLGSGNHLYAGGRFLTIGGAAALNIAEWDGNAWNAMDLGLSRTSGFTQVLHMVSWDDGSGEALYVGGRFNIAGGAPVSTNVAKWDGVAWSSMGDGFNADVQELVVFDDGTGEALYAMGNFVTSGATSTPGIAKWNGSEWKPVNSSINGNIYGGIVYDTGEGESLIIGGGFSNVDAVSANRVVALLQQPGCPADFTGDGMLDFFDISAFVTAYGNMESSADFTNDGAWDFFDISAFITAYSAGCP